MWPGSKEIVQIVDKYKWFKISVLVHYTYTTSVYWNSLNARLGIFEGFTKLFGKINPTLKLKS